MFPRKVIQNILPFLATHDILLLYGARQVGKSTLMKFLQKEHLTQPSLFFDLEDREYLELFNRNPKLFVDYLKFYHAWNE